MSEGFLDYARSYARNVKKHVQAVISGDETPRHALKRVRLHARRLGDKLLDESVDHEKSARLTHKGRVYYKEANYAYAEDTLRQALQFDSGNAYAHLYLGLTLLKARRSVDGIGELQKVLEVDPQSKAADKARRALVKAGVALDN